MLSSKWQKILKAFHLLFVCFWVGAATCIFSLFFIKEAVTDSYSLYLIDLCIHVIDWYVLIYFGVNGTILTGLIYGFFTKWGFVKHFWIAFKWLVTLAIVTFGFLFLGVWETELLNKSKILGLNALIDPEYAHTQKLYFYFGTLQLFLLISLIFISTIKPWRSISSTKKT